LAVSAVGATALFSGISGSSAADVAAFGRISVSEMSRYNYSKGYAAAVVAAAGTFANLIPPSLGIVVYGIVAKESIGKLMLAGVIPGLLSMIILAMFVYLRAVRSPASAGFGGWLAPKTPFESTSIAHENLSPVVEQRSWLSDSQGVLYGILIFGIVVGGLYGGLFTPTEAGAVAAFASLIIAALTPRSIRKVTFTKMIGRSLIETSQFTSMIFLLLIGGSVFSYFLASGGYATELATWASSLNVPPRLLVALILLILLPLGMLLEGLAILLLAIPDFAPIVTELGFSGVWFGILSLKVIEIGLIMPPFGINVFVSAGVNDMSPHVVFRQILPFAALDLGVTALLFACPDIVLWLPRFAGYP
jgi:tripartite ATP-independent transporter DctM subunit